MAFVGGDLLKCHTNHHCSDDADPSWPHQHGIDIAGLLQAVWTCGLLPPWPTSHAVMSPQNLAVAADALHSAHLVAEHVLVYVK